MADKFGFGDKTRPIQTIENLSNKLKDLTETEKDFIFNYIKEGNIPENSREVATGRDAELRIVEPLSSYKQNVYLIIECFLTYGFIPALLEVQGQERDANLLGSFFSRSNNEPPIAGSEYIEA